MQFIDWIILFVTIVSIVGYGTYKSRNSNNIAEFVINNQKTNWLTIGLSVMATQASAITFLSTPGQAYHDGMGFVQFYFGMPLALIVVCIVFIPIYHRLKVYTAYEYLEKRFDSKTRSLASFLFLIQRGLGTGLTIYAPSIILSTLLGWDITFLNILIGSLILIYTISGGSKALNITQTIQMLIILLGIVFVFIYIIYTLPNDLSFSNILNIASANNKLQIIDTSFNPETRYTIWSGLAGGFFLSLAYFGTDQSQVGRYITGKSINEITKGLIMNGIFKVPMQFFILLTGIMVFIFYQFNSSPIHFNPTNTQKVLNSVYKDDFIILEKKLEVIQNEKKEVNLFYLQQLKNGHNNHSVEKYLVALNTKEISLREQAKKLIKKADPSTELNDKDYVFLNFVLNYLPQGLIGLILAIIISAAMSSASSGLLALGTTTTFDVFLKNVKKTYKKEDILTINRIFILFWGVVAIVFACISNMFENLIQLVNIIGSIFYGTILGIFLVALFFKPIKNVAIFYGAILSQLIIFYIYYQNFVSFLWLNFIGALLTISISYIIQFFKKN
jgi:solute:Na+ symporter, SSS family